jgi:hypothetical protein
MMKAAGARRKGRAKSVRRKSDGVFLSPSAERDAAIDKIVKSAGNEPDDRQLLISDLAAADIRFAETFYWRTAAGGSLRAKVKRIRKTLADIADEIERDPILKKLSAWDTSGIRELGRWFPEWQKARVRAKHQRLVRGDRARAPIEWLIDDLIRIYEQRFQVPATWSWRGEEPHGAVIDFIEASLAELIEAPCDRATIGRAFSAHRAKTKKNNADLPND